MNGSLLTLTFSCCFASFCLYSELLSFYVGGQERVCLLDDEETVVEGTMRATGDWVQVRDSQLYFLGRKDRLIKHFGQRVHLDALQQVSDICVM